MRKRNCVQIDVEAMMYNKRSKKVKNLDQRNARDEFMIFESMKSAQIHLTKRALAVKVTLPKLKFMEKEYV